MKKLLHEMLRNRIRIEQGCIETDSGVTVIALNENEMLALADEIEKYYIPRPRFEGGEPVQFGDDTDELNGVEKFIFMRSCGGRCQMQDADGNMLTVFPGDFVKRPASEALDSDGVPIEEGDTVYGMGREQHRYTVQVPYSMDGEYGERFCVQCYDHDDGIIAWCDPSMLTHREPDSLEKLRDDMIDLCGTDGEDSSLICDELADCAARLTAIIERGA